MRTSKLDLYEALVKAIREADIDPEDMRDDLESAETSILKFPKYFNAVIETVVRSRTLSKDNISHYQYQIMHLDEMRRSAHISVAIAVNKLNRLCRMYNVEQMFDIDNLSGDNVDDREKAANAVYNFCKETFLDEEYRSGYAIKDEVNMDEELMQMADDQEEREMRSSYKGQQMFHTELTEITA